MKLLNAVVFFILVPTLTPALDPLSTSVFMGSAAVAWQLLSPVSWLKCSLLECCSMKDTLNISVIKMDLDRKVFGQHLAIQIVLRALSANMHSKRPRKPLVMSFHGWTGTGKSFVSNIIAENLYQLNIPRRRFVHHFSTVLHFPHLSHVHLYKVLPALSHFLPFICNSECKSQIILPLLTGAAAELDPGQCQCLSKVPFYLL
uniref:Torsin-1A n=1 Tax=Otus sunia TaxID=257818 RepID=A0A8C8B1R4_9STRI